jgi:histidinol dehydrogenase
MKSSSIGFVTRNGFETLRRVVPTLSADEGFSAHHQAVENWNLPGEPS